MEQRGSEKKNEFILDLHNTSDSNDHSSTNKVDQAKSFHNNEMLVLTDHDSSQIIEEGSAKKEASFVAFKPRVELTETNLLSGFML